MHKKVLELTVKVWSEGGGCNYPNMRKFIVITPYLLEVYVIDPNNKF